MNGPAALQGRLGGVAAPDQIAGGGAGEMVTLRGLGGATGGAATLQADQLGGRTGTGASAGQEAGAGGAIRRPGRGGAGSGRTGTRWAGRPASVTTALKAVAAFGTALKATLLRAAEIRTFRAAIPEAGAIAPPGTSAVGSRSARDPLAGGSGGIAAGSAAVRTGSLGGTPAGAPTGAAAAGAHWRSGAAGTPAGGATGGTSSGAARPPLRAGIGAAIRTGTHGRTDRGWTRSPRGDPAARPAALDCAERAIPASSQIPWPAHTSQDRHGAGLDRRDCVRGAPDRAPQG